MEDHQKVFDTKVYISETSAVTVVDLPTMGPHPSLVGSQITRAISKPRKGPRVPPIQCELEPSREVTMSVNVLKYQLTQGETIKVKSDDGSGVLVTNVKKGHLLLCMDSKKNMTDWDLIESCT